MYSRKSVGPRMEPWGTPALTGYSCENFPSRTTRSCLLLRKEEIRPNIWPEIPGDISLWRFACQTLSKALNISNVTARVAPDLLKAYQIQLWEDLQLLEKTKTILEIRNLGHQQFYYLQVFKYYTEHRKRTNRMVVFSFRPFLNILKYRDHQWNLPTIWKTRLLQTFIEEFS